MINSLRREPLVRSALIVAAGSAISRSVAFARNTAFARLAGPEQLGLFSAGTAIFSILLPLIAGGRSAVLARHPGTFRRTFRFPLWLSACAFLIMSAASRPLSNLLFGTADYAPIIVLAGAALLGTTLFNLLIWALNGFKDFRAAALLEAAYGGVFLIAGLICLLGFRGGAVSLMVANALALLLVAALAAFRLRARPSAAADVARFGRWALLAEIGYAFLNYGLFGRLILGRLVPAEAAGRFFAALNAANFLLGGVTVSCRVLLPSLSELVLSGSGERSTAAMRASLKPLLGAYLAGAALFLINARWLMERLYGARFAAAADLMPVVLCAYAYHAVYYLNATFALALGRSRDMALSILPGAAAQLILAPALTRVFGIQGTCWALLCSFALSGAVLQAFNGKGGLAYGGAETALLLLPLGLLWPACRPFLAIGSAAMAIYFLNKEVSPLR